MAKILGGIGNDILGGTAGDDSINGGAGRDTIDGGAGNDTIDGGAGGDELLGGLGNDLILAGAGDAASDVNKLKGDDGNDTIISGAGSDQIEGGAGNDSITGGGGNDNMRGGTGMDSYAFAAGSGKDTIRDFAAADDQLMIANNVNGSGIVSVATAVAHTSATAGGVIVDLGGGNSVTLVGVSLADVQANGAAYFTIV